MDFILNLMSGGLGTVLGGITGVVGTWLKSKHEAKMFELRSKERAEERKHDIETLKLEGQNAIAIADIQREEADDIASAKAHAASYQTEPKLFSEGRTFTEGKVGGFLQNISSFLLLLLDFFRGAMRPGLTLYMAILNTLMYWQYRELLETYAIQPTPEQAQAVTMYFIASFTYLFTTAFVWWYGDRNRQEPPKTLR